MLEEYAIDREWFKDFILKDSYEFLKRNGIKDYDEDFAQKKAEYLKREGFLNIYIYIVNRIDLHIKGF